MSIVLSAEQERARTAILQWFRNPNKTKQWFFLNGAAGTGKSSVVTAITESIQGNVLYAAPTGKSALVMAQKGCIGAQTIHSLIYRPSGTGGDKNNIEKKQALLASLPPDSPQHKQLSAELKKLLSGVKPLFNLNLDSPLREARLLVVDEISMVGSDTMQDLLSFGVPILVQGDLWQLPPVGQKNFFKDIPADFSLTQVHRQAQDSPVLWLATLAREKKRLPEGRHGESLVTRDKGEVDALGHEQIIVGTHVVRHATNQKVRALKGYSGPYPNEGERVICKHNNAKLGLTNGDQFVTTSFEAISASKGIIGITNESLTTRVCCHLEYFVAKEPSPWEKMKAECFDLAWSITCHSAQGSQYESVYVLDQSRKFNEPSKWLYTAVSRAEQRVTVLLT